MDIWLPDAAAANISQHQCSFVLAETGAVLLQDTSRHETTTPFPSNDGRQFIPFNTDSRTVLTARGINNFIRIGHEGYYQFEIQWHCDGLDHWLPNTEGPYRTGPRKNREKKYVQIKKVGGGRYGHVWQVMNAHTGELMAVKKFHSLEGRHLELATREVDNLFRINQGSVRHDHILEILGSEQGDDWGEIFMPLKGGSLKALVHSTHLDMGSLAWMVLQQMLLALDCTAEHMIIHRDLKPDNILWEYDQNGHYHFRLADFGLSNDVAHAMTTVGTEPFMAPEVFYQWEQSPKIDVWSLFATIVWVKDVSGFRTSCVAAAAAQIHEALVEASTLPDLHSISAMASIQPRYRPSAKQLLTWLQTPNNGYDTSQDVEGLAGSTEAGPSLDRLDHTQQHITGMPRRGIGYSIQEADQGTSTEIDIPNDGIPFQYYEAYPNHSFLIDTSLAAQYTPGTRPPVLTDQVGPPLLPLLPPPDDG
jgi:serine/threonine protein kinase